MNNCNDALFDSSTLKYKMKNTCWSVWVKTCIIQESDSCALNRHVLLTYIVFNNNKKNPFQCDPIPGSRKYNVTKLKNILCIARGL